MQLSLLLVLLVLLPESAMAALFGNLFAGSAPPGLGVHDGVLAPCPDRPNCVASGSADTAHAVPPLPYRGEVGAAMARLAALIAAQEGARIVTQRDGYLHAEYQSRLMGFVDDLELLADPAAHAVQVRSASRLGYSDLGVNRARVDALRAAFAAVRS